MCFILRSGMRLSPKRHSKQGTFVSVQLFTMISESFGSALRLIIVFSSKMNSLTLSASMPYTNASSATINAKEIGTVL